MVKINTKNLGTTTLLAVLLIGVVLVSGCIFPSAPNTGSVDITGAWHGTYTSSRGSGEWSWVIEKSGNGYTGVLTTTGPYSGENIPVTVSLSSNKITVGWVAAGATFEGTVNGNKMSGTWRFQNGMDSGSWEGVRGESSITPKETSNAGQQSEGAAGLPVYSGSQETNQYNMWISMTGFSNEYSELHGYVVSGVSPSDIIKWYKSQFSDYTIEDEGTANVQGMNYAFLALRKGNEIIRVVALEQGGQTVYFVGKAKVSEEGESLPAHDMASGEEPLQRYPGSVMLSYSKEGAFPVNYDIEYGTNDAYDKVGDWFKNMIESQGGKITYQGGSSDTIELEFEKDDDYGTIYIGAPGAGRAYTSISVSYTKRSLPDHDLVSGTDPMERYPGAVMVDYSKSTMNMQGIGGSEVKAVYLTPDDFNTVKQWYLNKLNAMFGGEEGYSSVVDNGESIDAGGAYNNKMVQVHIDFEIHKKYTEVSVDYTTTETS